MQKFSLSKREFETLHLKEKILNTEKRIKELEKKSQGLGYGSYESENKALSGKNINITTAI